jgi:hypothetical protein
MDINQYNTWTNFFLILYMGMLYVYIISPQPVILFKNIQSKKELKKIFKDKNGNQYQYI